MDLPNIPTNVKDWDISTIDSMLDIPNIESEKIECKLKITGELSKHICAMANMSGGFIIIGLNEKRCNEKKYGFQKIGLDKNEGDTTMQKIGHAKYSIEPLPKISIECITEQDKMYPVIQVHEETSHKPFFIKERGVCYIRIDNSSKPASRHTIMNLFVSLEDRKNVVNLRATMLILKNDLEGTINYITSISSNDQTRPSRIDTSFIHSMAMKNQSFLVENDMFGEITKNTVSRGIITILQTIAKLNEQIKAYNSSLDKDIKEEIKNELTNSSFVLALDLMDLPKFIDKIISKCDEHISKYDQI